MAKYELREFTKESLEKTEKAWLGELKKSPDVFPGDVDRMFAFAKQDFDGRNDKAYGVFADGANIADSIVQIVVTKEGRKFAKMLDCFIRPSIYEKAEVNFDDSAMEKVVDIYLASIIGTLRIGGHHKANAIKVYGRTRALLTVLTIVAKHLKEEAAGAKTSIEGRWLVVKV